MTRLSIGLFWFLVSISPATADSANDLLPSCEVLIRQSQVRGGEVFVPEEGHPCWYYFNAIENVIILADPATNQPLLGVCAPPTSTLTQIIRVFTDYAQRNPSELHESGVIVGLRALRQAFPCR